jgi:hypothetical protein
MICKVQKEKITILGKNKNQKELRKQLFFIFIDLSIINQKETSNTEITKNLNSLPKNKFRKTEFTSFFLHLKNNK